MTTESHLTIISGPMYSGKSHTLINHYRDLVKRVGKDKIIAIKPNIDTRTSTIFSRSNGEIDCITIDDQVDIEALTENYTHVIFDEFQFYNKDFQNKAKKLLNKKNLIISGLDYTYEMKFFDWYEEFAEIANIKVKKTAICYFCKEAALFSSKINKNDKVIEIQHHEETPIYYSSCSKCFKRNI